jgi:hypothetical protein
MLERIDDSPRLTDWDSGRYDYGHQGNGGGDRYPWSRIGGGKLGLFHRATKNGARFRPNYLGSRLPESSMAMGDCSAPRAHPWLGAGSHGVVTVESMVGWGYRAGDRRRAFLSLTVVGVERNSDRSRSILGVAVPRCGCGRALSRCPSRDHVGGMPRNLS